MIDKFHFESANEIKKNCTTFGSNQIAVYSVKIIT